VTGPAPVFLLLAGEPSGDLHAAEVARVLRKRWPECRILGTGGERMAREGVELLAELDDLAVMGFVEVLARLPFFWGLERRVRDVLETEAVDLVIPVDYPGFNLRVTERAHGMGVPVLYYIAPQVWAWKAGRTARLARAADRVAVILPFEEELFREAGGRASFVGHPLLDRSNDARIGNGSARHGGWTPRRPCWPSSPGPEPRKWIGISSPSSEPPSCFEGNGRHFRWRWHGLRRFGFPTRSPGVRWPWGIPGPSCATPGQAS